MLFALSRVGSLLGEMLRWVRWDAMENNGYWSWVLDEGILGLKIRIYDCSVCLVDQRYGVLKKLQDVFLRDRPSRTEKQLYILLSVKISEFTESRKRGV